jgi:iron complex outermembrane receptor protein
MPIFEDTRTTFRFKGNRTTFDADAYHIRFQNSYASAKDTSGDANNGDTYYALQPSSITKGIEFETTMIPLQVWPQ